AAGVKVGAWPVTAGLTDDRRATAVDARLTVTSATPVLSAKPPAPTKEAVSAWRPTPSDTSRVAWPASLTRAVPRTVVPSRKLTVPIGRPPVEVTVAVSVTGWPETAVA